MTDPELKAPPPRKPNTQAVKHQRRPSFHTRRKSQHSIASFGDIADDVIKAPALGALGEAEAIAEEPSEDYEVGKVKPKKKKHDRKSSNIHELFGEDDEQASMDNIVHNELRVKLPQESLMLEEMDDIDGYSPRAIELEDAPESPVVAPPPKPSARKTNQSFGGIVDLFGTDELEYGSTNPEQEVKRLREENQRLLDELDKSNRIKKQLELEVQALRSSQRGDSSVDEIERIKTSKIRLILAAVSEIDRMRSIIVSHERNNSLS